MTTTTTILAVDPGIREIGVALFRDGHLDDCRVHSLRRSRPRQTRHQVLARVFTLLLDDARPTHVVVSAPAVYPGTDRVALARLVRAMRTLAAQRGAATSELAWDAAVRSVTGDPTATKRMVARAVCARYPHLTPRLPNAEGWRERYALRMFSAVATGLAHSHIQTDHARA